MKARSINHLALPTTKSTAFVLHRKTFSGHVMRQKVGYVTYCILIIKKWKQHFMVTRNYGVASMVCIN